MKKIIRKIYFIVFIAKTPATYNSLNSSISITFFCKNSSILLRVLWKLIFFKSDRKTKRKRYQKKSKWKKIRYAHMREQLDRKKGQKIRQHTDGILCVYNSAEQKYKQEKKIQHNTSIASSFLQTLHKYRFCCCCCRCCSSVISIHDATHRRRSSTLQPHQREVTLLQQQQRCDGTKFIGRKRYLRLCVCIGLYHTYNRIEKDSSV